MAEVEVPKQGADRGGLDDDDEGVLLYYKYAPVPDVPALVDLYESNCNSLGLLGRVRIAPDGVNVTVGGKMASLERHIEVMRSHSLFEGTDFKLASCNGPRDEKIARECGFTSLAIRVVTELVTFGSRPLLKPPSISNAGSHLSPVEFHTVLSGHGNRLESNGSSEHKKFILLDARNIYETRIGMFKKPEIETLNPEVRQYSDLPSWIDDHSDQLKGNNILMYCTGGIRCEMASAYIRSKGSGFENVYQLYGGIQRYLEHFPDGGFFRGKNFVFDHRISVGSRNTDILGSCILCELPFDDYSSRCRCSSCRMLVLVCDGCQENSSKVYVCELCQKNVKIAADFQTGCVPDGEQLYLDKSSDKSSDTHGTVHDKDDACRSVSRISLPCDLSRNPGFTGKLRILCLHGFRQNALSFKGRLASFGKKLKHTAELVFIDAPHELPFIYQQGQLTSDSNSADNPLPSPPQNCKRRFAWLVDPQSKDLTGTNWERADGPFDPCQYQQQTDGFERSYAYLKAKLSQMGPFDGILGFSQGAAMAALVCEKQQMTGETPNFRFAVLCSGFLLSSNGKKMGSVKLPSLHVFGSNKGGDRQIVCKASMELARLFDPSCSEIVEHDMGHIIPAKVPYICKILNFFGQFL